MKAYFDSRQEGVAKDVEKMTAELQMLSIMQQKAAMEDQMRASAAKNAEIGKLRDLVDTYNSDSSSLSDAQVKWVKQVAPQYGLDISAGDENELSLMGGGILGSAKAALMGSVDALLFGSLRDSWYSDRHTKRSANIGKWAGTAASLLVPYGAIAKLLKPASAAARAAKAAGVAKPAHEAAATALAALKPIAAEKRIAGQAVKAANNAHKVASAAVREAVAQGRKGSALIRAERSAVINTFTHVNKSQVDDVGLKMIDTAVNTLKNGGSSSTALSNASNAGKEFIAGRLKHLAGLKQNASNLREIKKLETMLSSFDDASSLYSRVAKALQKHTVTLAKLEAEGAKQLAATTSAELVLKTAKANLATTTKALADVSSKITPLAQSSIAARKASQLAAASETAAAKLTAGERAQVILGHILGNTSAGAFKGFKGSLGASKAALAGVGGAGNVFKAARGGNMIPLVKVAYPMIAPVARTGGFLIGSQNALANSDHMATMTPEQIAMYQHANPFVPPIPAPNMFPTYNLQQQALSQEELAQMQAMAQQ